MHNTLIKQDITTQYSSQNIKFCDDLIKLLIKHKLIKTNDKSFIEGINVCVDAYDGVCVNIRTIQ